MPLASRLVAAALAALLCCPSLSTAQVKTDLVPYTIEVPAKSAEPRYVLHGMFRHTDRGMTVDRLLDGSPLANMRRIGSTSRFVAEAGDHVLGIRDGSGRFVSPRSPAAVAAVVNSLPGPETLILIEDVRGTGSWVYQVTLRPNGKLPPPPPAKPGRIVVLLLGDTADKKIGPSVKSGIDGLEKLFTKETIRKDVRAVRVVTGGDFRHEKILSAINELEVGPGDTLFCFIDCHGAYDRKLGAYAGGHWFSVPGKPMSRRTLRETLSLKGARLTCLISEACNVPVAMPKAEMTYSTTVVEKNPKLRSLLLGPTGYLDMTSSKAGEYSWTGVFGPMLLEAMTETPNERFVLDADGRRRRAFARTLPVDKPTTWRAFADELRAGAGSYYHIVRDSAVRGTATSDANKKLLREQPDQTVTVFEFPK